VRKLVRQIIGGYKSLKLEAEEEGLVLYIGQDPGTRQAVSIKILPEALGADPQVAARFQSLARSIRQLNHPNILSVRKVGEESGLPYLVTLALEKGHSLAARLDQHWAVDAAADVVAQVGQALEHAYNKGVVHGSLTPEKVTVQEDGRVIVSDMGVAEIQNLLGTELRDAASPYLPPERASGVSIEPEADVYSLGAILYRMLTQRNPEFVHGEVLPPSRFNPDVPPAMDKVVTRALATDPAERYPDVRAFLAALGAVTVAPRAKRRPAVKPGQCANCGAEDQTGKFCRKCGSRVERSVLDEPIQITSVEVGHVEQGAGVEVHQVTIAQPLQVATGEQAEHFPEPLPMPELETESLWPSPGDEPPIAMPEPAEMPVIDWAEIAPPMPEVPTVEETPAEEDEEGG
jgi:hypothetical protein